MAKVYRGEAGWMVDGPGYDGQVFTFGPFQTEWDAIYSTPFFDFVIYRN